MIACLVAEVLAEVTGLHPAECAREDAQLFTDLGLDSLTLLETIERLQQCAHCLIPDEMTARIQTVGGLQQAVARCADTAASRIGMSEEYLRGHASVFFERANRFMACGDRLRHHGLADRDILVDLGAGLTELDYHLRVSYGWRGRYVPVDAWVDGIDLMRWTPPRPVQWLAALEVLEHLDDPRAFVRMMQGCATKGVVVTTPNADSVDVLAMDPSHKSPLRRSTLEEWGMHTTLHNFYGHYQDGIAGVWTRPAAANSEGPT